jgi:hypothetical protein
MENKLSFDKVFISSGCSYTTPLPYAHSIVNNSKSEIKNKKTLFSHIGLPSASIKHLKISTISFVDYLLKNGIKNENIYLVGNLTQIGRKSFKYNDNEYDYINKIIKNKIEWNHDSSVGEYKMIKYPYGFCELNGDIFSTMAAESSFYTTLPSDIKKRMSTYVNYHNNLSMDELVEDYFSDLLILQEYLKKNKIEYTLFFMSNILEGWDSKYMTHKYINFYGKYEVPDLRNTYNIKNINQQVKSIFDLIDFDNIVYYSNETQTYGGIDEYAIENFKPTDFAGRENIEIKDYYGHGYYFFGQHPLENVQYEFEKKFIYPKMENFIKKHYVNNYENII